MFYLLYIKKIADHQKTISDNREKLLRLLYVFFFAMMVCMIDRVKAERRLKAKIAAKIAAEKARQREPEDCRVVLLNDNWTPQVFVVTVLMYVFHKSEADATRIMLDIHRNGAGVVGLYPEDIALTLADRVESLARDHEYPLKALVQKQERRLE
jgi:ATP-dependent Clp protease adaptor protein ClpS